MKETNKQKQSVLFSLELNINFTYVFLEKICMAVHLRPQLWAARHNNKITVYNFFKKTHLMSHPSPRMMPP